MNLKGKKPWSNEYKTITATHGEGNEFGKIADQNKPPKSALKEK